MTDLVQAPEGFPKPRFHKKLLCWTASNLQFHLATDEVQITRLLPL